MSDKSAIEWTDATWQIASGCSPVSAACRGCYSARLAGTRLKHHPRCAGLTRQAEDGRHVWTGEVQLHPDQLAVPLRWRRGRRIFVGDRTDLFHPSIPDDYIDKVWAVMALCPQHTFQVLTKRPERMREYLDRYRPAMDGAGRRLGWVTPDGDRPVAYGGQATTIIADDRWPLPNVWMGVSIEDQDTADARIPHLLATPAAVRFVSAEPLLGAVDLANHFAPKWWGACPCVVGPTEQSVEVDRNGVERCPRCDTALGGSPETLLHWVIVGGESGPHARPMHPDWARSLRDQCAAAGVPYYFKQWGEWAEADIWHHDNGKTSVQGLAHDPASDDLYGERERYVEWAWMEPAAPGATLRITVARVGKSAAGRLLDGVEHNAMPGGDRG